MGSTHISRDEMENKVKEMEDFIEELDPNIWRSAFNDLFADIIMENPFKETIRFLFKMFHDAKEIRRKKLESSETFPVDPMPERKPIFFNLEKWRQLVTRFGFEIEEPDSNRELLYCTIHLIPQVSMVTLTGICTLLESFHGLSYQTYRSIMTLSPEDASRLINMFHQTNMQDKRVNSTTCGDSLWANHKELMEKLGFFHTDCYGSSQKKNISDNNVHDLKNENASLLRVVCVLLGMFGQATDGKKETLV